MKWHDVLLNADITMTCEARKSGKARLTVNYYGDRNGVVRKFMEKGRIETQEVYDRGVDED